MPYLDFLLLFEKFDAFFNVMCILFQSWCCFEHGLAVLELLQSLVWILNLLTLAQFEILECDKRDAIMKGERVEREG